MRISTEFLGHFPPEHHEMILHSLLIVIQTLPVSLIMMSSILILATSCYIKLGCVGTMIFRQRQRSSR